MESKPLEIASFQPTEPIRIRHATLESFAFWSTICGVFAGSQGINFSHFTLRPFYGVAIVNLILFTVIVGYRKLPAWAIYLFSYLALSGVIGIVNGTSTVLLVMKSLVGMTVSAFYYFYFFKMENNSFERAFLAYTEVAVWFAAAALPIWIIENILDHKYIRLHGLLREPEMFSLIILPATYWHANQALKNHKSWPKAALLLLTLILANSSLGFIGLLFAATLLMSKTKSRLLILPLIVCSAAFLMYTFSPEFQRRTTDTILSISSQDLSQANLSTYALLSNAYVVQQVIERDPLLGNGLGSHSISHATYVSQVPGYEIVASRGDQDLQADDSGSLLLRVLSDLGLVGISVVLIFLVHFYVGGASMNSDICRAILVCFFVKLIRDGTYFNPEQFFFIYIYILNYRDWRKGSSSQLSEALA